MNEPRKASDIILSLETKIDQLIQLHQALDFNTKCLSNKLNEVIIAINNNSKSTSISPFTVEAPKTILTSKENQLPLETAPTGFRRTSRPETFTSTPPQEAEIKLERMPVKAPAEVVIPSSAPASVAPPTKKVEGNSISVQQRIVDNTGKAVFLANIEIIDKQSKNVVYKGRTNGIGKWAAPLFTGEYQVSIKKSKSLDKSEIDVSQALIVDGAQNPLNLQTMIVK